MRKVLKLSIAITIVSILMLTGTNKGLAKTDPVGGATCGGAGTFDGICMTTTVNGVSTSKCHKASANQDCMVATS